MSDVSEAAETYGATLRGGAAAAAQPPVHLVSLLEERIASLVERHRDSRKRVEELEAALAEREARIGELTQQSGDQQRIRAEARDRVARLIERVAELEKQPQGAGPAE
jgi:uncharacterized coiled-coil protein SlyX